MDPKNLNKNFFKKITASSEWSEIWWLCWYLVFEDPKKLGTGCE